MKLIMRILKACVLFPVGGTIYIGLELLWRGHSHWTMFVLGGVCFLALGEINEVLPWETPLLLQMLLGGAIITTLEWCTGVIVNLRLHWAVWDYSALPFNLCGQICLGYSLLWCLVSLPGIVLDDWLRYWWFGEQKPHYKIF